MQLNIPTEVAAGAAGLAVGLADELKGFLKQLVGPVCTQAGEILADPLRVYRLERQISLLKKTKAILDRERISPKAVNMKVLLPLLDAASLEDDSTLADTWAALLASAADPNRTNEDHAAYIDILKQLSPKEVLIVDTFYRQMGIRNLTAGQKDGHGVETEYLKGMLKFNDEAFGVALDNLLRLRLLQHPTVSLGNYNGHDVRINVTTAGILCATELGEQFAKACDDGKMRPVSYSIPGTSISNIYNLGDGHLELKTVGVWG